MNERVSCFYDERMLGHHPTGWDPDHPEWTEAVRALLAVQYPDKPPQSWTHPERPERVSGVRDWLAGAALPRLDWRAPEPASEVALRRVHTEEHVRYINSLHGRSGWLSVDTTAVSPASVTAARLAAGAAIAAVDLVMDGDTRRAFCLVRPPGHHALPERAMGFCLYNNVAVAAAHALAATTCQRVMIFDWDLHHGNGTQAAFYDNPDVLFIDTHCQAPFYPGTGHIEETGDGRGAGTTINVPLPPGSGNAAMLRAIERIVAPAARLFQPDLLLVSAGYDMHGLDQTMTMDNAGFSAVTARVADLADELCGGRLALVLEGGYHADALAGGVEASLRAMVGERMDEAEQDDNDPGLAAVERAAAFHGLLDPFPGNAGR